MLRTLHRLRRSRSYNKICNSSSSDEDSSLGSPSRESSIDEEDYENWKTKYNLIGGVCASCKEEIDENGDLQGEDGINMYCTICAAPGDLLICDDLTCERVFCTGCIELLLNPSVVERINETDPWECFICNNIS